MDTHRRHEPYLEIARQVLANVPLSMVLSDPKQPDNPIIYVNRTFERVTGYAAADVLGRNCRFLQRDDRDQPGVRDLAHAVQSRQPVVVTLTNYRADGSAFLNRLMIAPIFDDDGSLVAFIGLQAEVTEERIARGAAVARFENRLQEMQHRVKNHLQMVSSMIRLQARDRNQSSSDGFDVVARRVDALALLYEEIGAPPGETGERVRYDVVSAGLYVSRVATTVGALDAGRSIRIGIDTDAVYMRTDRAAQLGLLVSEILSNTLKHAFAGREDGVVDVSLKQDGWGHVRLVVEDDGVGMGDKRWPEEGNLGARIVRGLLQQLEARLDVASSPSGTKIAVDFTTALEVVPDEDGARMLADGEAEPDRGDGAAG